MLPDLPICPVPLDINRPTGAAICYDSVVLREYARAYGQQCFAAGQQTALAAAEVEPAPETPAAKAVDSYVQNCHITMREDDKGPLFHQVGNQVFVRLDGYDIRPLGDAALSARPEAAAVPDSKEHGFVWSCKIGGPLDALPEGADAPLRKAIEQAFRELTGRDAEFTFSGWGEGLNAREIDCIHGKPEGGA